MSTVEDEVKQRLVARISANERGKLSLKLKTLVADFGFAASRNLRQSSLDTVLKMLASWCISYNLPDGKSANDYITLSLGNDIATPQIPSASSADMLASDGSDSIVPSAEYRVLSVRPPWAWAIIFAGKDIENRSWATPYRGRILIHASSKKFVGENLREVRQIIAESSGLPASKIPAEFPRSQILGSVELVDCVEKHRSPWAYPGEIHWVLRDPQPLACPVRNVDGKLNLWRWTAP